LCSPVQEQPELLEQHGPGGFIFEHQVVTAFVALRVFERIGVGIRRRAWFNLDLIWSAALIATGTLTLVL